jgi:CRISPR-associated endoribonuclease Cas6
MRIKVILGLVGERLPILYRQRFMDLIISALKEADVNYENSIYPNKNMHLKVAKPFAFSVLLPEEFICKKEKFKIDENFEVEDLVFAFKKGETLSMYVSSYNPEFLLHLHNGLLKLGSFQFDEKLTLKINKIFMLNENKINDLEIIYKTMSPILIETINSKPILPIDMEGNLLKEKELSIFNSNFNAIHDRILKDIRGSSLYKELVFTPIKIKKQVVKHTLRDFREQTGKPYMTFTTFEGIFKIAGDPRDLKALYQMGIGLRTGQGFGMVEVIA